MRPGPRPEAGRRGAPAPLPVPAALQGASPGPREAGGPGRRGRPLAVHAQVEVGDAGTVFVSPGLPAHGVPTSPEKTRGHGDTCLPPLRAPAASPVRLCRDPRFPELDRGRSPSVRLGCCVAPSSLPLGEVHPGGAGWCPLTPTAGAIVQRVLCVTPCQMPRRRCLCWFLPGFRGNFVGGVRGQPAQDPGQCWVTRVQTPGP